MTEIQPIAYHKTRVLYKNIDVNGISIFYREAGDPSAPPLVLMHGWPSSSFHFRDLIPILAENFHVFAADQPGLGHSAMPPHTDYAYTFDNIAATYTKFTELIGLKKFAMYITDFGTGYGWLMAKSNPDRITAIISQSGPAYNVGIVDAKDAVWQQLIELCKYPTPERRKAMESALTFEYTRFPYITGAADLTMVAPDTYHLDHSLFQRPGQADIQIDLMISYCDFILNRLPEAQAYLREYQPPLLCAWGAYDPYYPKEGTEAFKADVKDVEIKLYAAGHFALETHVREIAADVTEFLKRKLL